MEHFRGLQNNLKSPKKDAQCLNCTVMFHESHPGISWPTFLVIIPDNILIIGVRMLCEVPLDEIFCLLMSESEEHVDFVNVP